MAVFKFNPSAAPNLRHLNYGGRKTSWGQSPKSAMGQTFKKLKRFETMVRLENAGIPEIAAAAMLCISLKRLKHLKRSSDYLNARIKITHGIILNNESELAMIKEQRKEMLTQLLPSAFQVLANEIQRPANSIAERRHQVAIVQDYLDREGTFAKVSRTEVKPVDSFDFERADEASKSIINAIRSVAAAPLGAMNSIGTGVKSLGTDSTNLTHTLAAVEANAAFSNSHTLSATDQQQALEALEASAEAEALEMLQTLPTDGLVN